MSNFIKKLHKKIFITLSLMLFAIPVAAISETIIMECTNEYQKTIYYKYEKSFFVFKNIYTREQAEWKPWCDGSASIMDKGAKCVETKEKKISRTVYNYSSYTVSDVNKAKKVLTNRWTFCQYNKEQETCQNGNKYLSIAQLQSSLHNDFFNGCEFEPQNETSKPFDVRLEDYLKKHLPKKGDKKCALGKKYVPDVERFDIITTLDFLLPQMVVSKGNYRYQNNNYEVMNKDAVKYLTDKWSCKKKM
jgi:hypothetical protein